MIGRIVLIILDSLGVGELPDASLYGDEGSNTLGNIDRAVGGLSLPNLGTLGIGRILSLAGVPPQPALGSFGKMAEMSPGKDTTTGHWEIAGIILDKPFPTFPHGFPPQIIEAYEKAIGTRVLGNVVASGTQIIEDLGPEHMSTGFPIVYTSADSVFQVAAHEGVIPLQELYRMCKIAREMLVGEYAVGRVIARPFTGIPGNFVRTINRHDYSLVPPYPTVLDHIAEEGYDVIGVGKIKDIFAGQGITKNISTTGNLDGLNQLASLIQDNFRGLVIANLVDYDSKYGHRNDVQGYAKALQEFDWHLPMLMEGLKQNDVLIITADHGCDPTTPSTDHSREYVPLMLYGQGIRPDTNLGIRSSFADLGATLAEFLQVKPPRWGRSFAGEVLIKLNV